MKDLDGLFATVFIVGYFAFIVYKGIEIILSTVM